MTTMLSLILAFMLSIGGSPAASVNPAGCPGDTGIQAPDNNNPIINNFFDDYREKTASRPISKKILEIPLIKQPKTQIRLRFSLYLKEELRLMGYIDSMNMYQAFEMNPVNFNDPLGAAIDSPTRFTRYRYNPNAGFWGLTWEGSSKGMYEHGGEALVFGALLATDAISVPFDKAFDVIDWAAQKTGVAQFFGFKPGETKAVLSLGLLLASGQPETAMVGTATGATLSRINVFGKYFGRVKNFLKGLPSKINVFRKSPNVVKGGTFDLRRYLRNRSAISIRKIRKDLAAAGFDQSDINSIIKAFDLSTIRYKTNLNFFSKRHRFFTFGENPGGSWLTTDKSMINASPIMRKIRLALPKSNLATGKSWTRITFGRKIISGEVAHQPSLFTGLPSSINTGGVSQIYVMPGKYLTFRIFF